MSSARLISDLNAAAIKIQSLYRSYRTRRRLADSGVVVEQLRWKALDFAALKSSSISFFNNDLKQETAYSRWARARTRAAKVGKGLSKNEKAQKLALQNWLEVIDPRHRYGYNLSLYYEIWIQQENNQPFFYWLDIGDGKEVEHVKCPRSKLQRQCIKYLGPNEREAFEVIVENGKLVYRQSGIPVDNTERSKLIFVLSPSRTLYVGEKKKGAFHHSSFLAGGATVAAGKLVAHDGVLEEIWPYSGYYQANEDNIKEIVTFFEEQNVDLTNVKVSVNEAFLSISTIEDSDTGSIPLLQNENPSGISIISTNEDSDTESMGLAVLSQNENSFDNRIEHKIDIKPDENDNCNHNTKNKVSAMEWVFVVTNCILELLSAVFGQLSSVHKPQYALTSMVMSFIIALLSIAELVHKGQKEGVTWSRKDQILWFRYPPPSQEPFGDFPDFVGLVCGILQFVFATVAYVFICRNANNPVKISICSIIFAFGILFSRILRNSGRTRSRSDQKCISQ